MKNNQKYEEEYKDIYVFIKLFNAFFQKMHNFSYTLQQKALTAVYNETIKILNNVITNRLLEIDSPAFEYINIKAQTSSMQLSNTAKALKKLIDTPEDQMSNDWFYTFVLISHNIKQILNNRKEKQQVEKLIYKHSLELDVIKNKKSRIKGGLINASIYDNDRIIAEETYKEFKRTRANLIELFKKYPNKAKPKTELKNLLKRKCNNRICERTLQNWAKELLKNDGKLKKRKQLAENGLSK